MTHHFRVRVSGRLVVPVRIHLVFLRRSAADGVARADEFGLARGYLEALLLGLEVAQWVDLEEVCYVGRCELWVEGFECGGDVRSAREGLVGGRADACSRSVRMV